ncbi:DUF4142 domain-containing protein [Amycolatopsis anabasis]|uniref:DUF4142 domain-containing protein n=1 Tax=Amycolatopsis anabasis TaxID=1840409 RepID=UPI001FECD557|nr:DUF4142 domain-containing protein [Amycolatopsis anabasis]
MARAFALLFVVFFGVAGPAVATAQPRFGPLGPADVELLSKVRQAGLWEMPAGDWARTRAASPMVRQVGMTIMVDHGRLDSAVRELAAELGVGLPEQPNADQQSWLNEMRNATSGAEFDQIFVNRLRAAHGQVFSVIAQVRAGTRNERIRSFATTSNQAVLRHITLLESTGLVDHGRLPEPATSTTAKAGLDLDAADFLVLAVLVPLEIVATVFVLAMVRNPPKKGKRRAAVGAVPLFAKKT